MNILLLLLFSVLGISLWALFGKGDKITSSSSKNIEPPERALRRRAADREIEKEYPGDSAEDEPGMGGDEGEDDYNDYDEKSAEPHAEIESTSLPFNLPYEVDEIISDSSRYRIYKRTLLNSEIYAKKGDFETAVSLYEGVNNRIQDENVNRMIEENIGYLKEYKERSQEKKKQEKIQKQKVNEGKSSEFRVSIDGPVSIPESIKIDLSGKGEVAGAAIDIDSVVEKVTSKLSEQGLLQEPDRKGMDSGLSGEIAELESNISDLMNRRNALGDTASQQQINEVNSQLTDEVRQLNETVRKSSEGSAGEGPKSVRLSKDGTGEDLSWNLEVFNLNTDELKTLRDNLGKSVGEQALDDVTRGLQDELDTLIGNMQNRQAGGGEGIPPSQIQSPQNQINELLNKRKELADTASEQQMNELHSQLANEVRQLNESMQSPAGDVSDENQKSVELSPEGAGDDLRWNMEVFNLNTEELQMLRDNMAQSVSEQALDSVKKSLQNELDTLIGNMQKMSNAGGAPSSNVQTQPVSDISTAPSVPPTGRSVPAIEATDIGDPAGNAISRMMDELKQKTDDLIELSVGLTGQGVQFSGEAPGGAAGDELKKISQGIENLSSGLGNIITGAGPGVSIDTSAIGNEIEELKQAAESLKNDIRESEGGAGIPGGSRQLEDEIQQLKQGLEDLSSEVNSAAGAPVIQMQGGSPVISDDGSVNDQLQASANEIQKLNDKIESLTEESNRLKRMGASSPGFDGQFGSGSNEIQKLNDKIESLTDESNRLKEMGAFSPGFDGQIGSSSNEIQKLNDQIESLTEESNRLKGMGASSPGFDGQFGSGSNEIQKFTDKIESLAEERKKMQEEIQQLRSSQDGIAGDSPGKARMGDGYDDQAKGGPVESEQFLPGGAGSGAIADSDTPPSLTEVKSDSPLPLKFDEASVSDLMKSIPQQEAPDAQVLDFPGAKDKQENEGETQSSSYSELEKEMMKQDVETGAGLTEDEEYELLKEYGEDRDPGKLSDEDLFSKLIDDAHKAHEDKEDSFAIAGDDKRDAEFYYDLIDEEARKKQQAERRFYEKFLQHDRRKKKDLPILSVTYDFSRLPDVFSLSRDKNILEYSFYKFKPMLERANHLIRHRKVKDAINYYRVVMSQNIPPEFKGMIRTNINDLTEYLEKYLASG